VKAPTLRIEGDAPLGYRTTVKLNGTEVPGLRSLRLEMTNADMNVVTLVIGVGEVDVDAEVLAELTALVERQS